MTTLTFDISGMTCGGCVARVNKAFGEWADKAETTLSPPRLTLINPKTQDLAQLAAVAQAAGAYSISPVTPAALSHPFLERRTNVPERRAVQAGEPGIEAAPASIFATYKPLLLTIAFITAASFITPLREQSFNAHVWMHDFMGIWLVAFAFFKLLDLRSFAAGFARYDPLAAALPGYGKAYPFIELALGAGFLFYWSMVAVSALTILVLGITTVGVLRAIARKQMLQCACLGTGFALPVGWATVAENLLMIGMAASMILHAGAMM
jgi:copper chaperone CopZ